MSYSAAVPQVHQAESEMSPTPCLMVILSDFAYDDDFKFERMFAVDGPANRSYLRQLIGLEERCSVIPTTIFECGTMCGSSMLCDVSLLALLPISSAILY